MIIGRTQSADGGFRRIPIRHTQIVDDKTRLSLVDYLKEIVYKKCLETGWVGCRDVFPNLPEDIMGTPLQIIYDICCEKFKDQPDIINANLAKYLGMLIREAVYYSDVEYFELMTGSIRTYSLATKNLKTVDYKKNRENLINGAKK